MSRQTQVPNEAAVREKQIVAGLFLSKFDQAGLKALGFSGFTEAFNAIGFALGAKPASIKNYRDEFDPVFSSQRKGWHKRPLRAYCKAVSERYKHLSLAEFSTLVKSLTYSAGELDVLEEKADDTAPSDSSFAKRLITGLAAENYFESVHPTLPILQDYILENVSRIGCGFDFKLSNNLKPDFLAVEVKGLNESRGTLSLTEKEHRVAGILKDRFFLFIVRNFRESPFHNIYPNPLNSNLIFARQEKRIVQVSWSLSI
jgi:hypothetical protein